MIIIFSLRANRNLLNIVFQQKKRHLLQFFTLFAFTYLLRPVNKSKIFNNSFCTSLKFYSNEAVFKFSNKSTST